MMSKSVCLHPRSLTVIVKVTEACNYSCSFCRYADGSHADCELSLEDAFVVVDKLAAYNLRNGVHEARLLFHGGEPLLWGRDNFQRIIEHEKRLEAELGVRFRNSIQTSASLIDDDWIDFFVKFNMAIGVSLDGPAYLNSHYGPLGNDNSVRIVVDNYNKMKAKGINPGLLCVITNNHLKHAKDLYSFWVENNIDNVGLCFCFDPCGNDTVEPVGLGMFLAELFDLYFFNSNRIDIREFNASMKKKIADRAISCTFASRSGCGSYLSVSPNMDVYFCDSYSLGGDACLGSLDNSTFDDIVLSKKYQKMRRDYSQATLKICSECNVKDYCGMGCGRTDSNGRNTFCDAYQILYSHIDSVLESVLQPERIG